MSWVLRRPEQRMIWRRILNILVWLALLAGAVVAVGVGLLFYRPGPDPFPSAGAFPSAQIQSAEQSAQALRKELERVARAVEQGTPTTFTWPLRDEDINTYFAAHPEGLRSYHPDFRGLQVQFHAGGAVSLDALIAYRGREVAPHVEGTLEHLGNRQVRFTVEEAQLGILPLPGKLRRELAEAIDRALSEELQKLPPAIQLESLFTTEGELVLQGEVTAAE